MDEEEFNLDVGDDTESAVPATSVAAPAPAAAPVPTTTPAPAPAPAATPVEAPVITSVVEKPSASVAAVNAVAPAPTVTVSSVASASAVPPPAAAASAVSNQNISGAISVPLDSETEKILQRSARFGTAPPAAIQQKLEEEKKAARAARFGIEIKPTEEQKTNKNSNKNKKQETSAIPDEVLQKRIARFGAVSSAAVATVQNTLAEEEAKKIAKRKERFGENNEQPNQ